MKWELVVTKSAGKNLRRLPPKDRERVKAALVAMGENPFSGDVVRLKGQEDTAWRRRVGDWRIFYDLQHCATPACRNCNQPAHFDHILIPALTLPTSGARAVMDVFGRGQRQPHVDVRETQ